MFNILDNILRREQLIFLQKVIETVNSVLTIEQMDTVELQRIIFNISLEELGVDTDDVRSLRESLKELLGAGDEAVHYLMDKLHDYQSRYLASSFLGWFGNRANAAIPELIDLASGHGPATGAAQKAIIFIGGGEQQLLHAVEEALGSGNDESFAQLGTLALKTNLKSSDVFFEILERGAAHLSPHIREAVADIIWHLERLDAEKVKLILSSLSTDENKNVRDAALSALESLNSATAS